MPPQLYMLFFIILSFMVLSMAGKAPWGRNGQYPHWNRVAVQSAGGTVLSGSAGTDKKADKKSKGSKASQFMNPFAIYKQSGVGSTNISGKIGGTVWNKNGTLRIFAMPRNRRTAAQQLVKGLLSGISSAFQSLTSSQVTAWNSSAASDNPNSVRRTAFGDIRSLTGSQMYQRINNILISIGQAVMSDAPGAVSNDAIIGMTATAASGGPSFVIDPTLFSGGVVLPANTYLKVYATNQTSNGRSFFGASKYRFIGYFSPADSIVAMDILSLYTAVFNPLVAGQKIGVAAELITTDGTTTFGKTGKAYATAVVS